ncbi:MAG: tetratricopeptide repeat protein [Myxococcota bacterium]
MSSEEGSNLEEGSIPRAPLGSRPDALDSIDMERIRVAMAKNLFGRTLPPVCIDRFEIRTSLGRGSMGRVFSAWDPRLQRTVALKLVAAEPDGSDAAGQTRRLREARALATVAHPNVVDVFEVGTWRTDVFLAMEHVDGTSLRQWLEASAREPAQIVEIFAQVAQGLGAIHRAGLVHRDVKPDNAMVDAEGRARVVDLGLARAPPGGEPTDPVTNGSTQSSTVPGSTAGTPAYMAPEQRRGEFGPASDQYSLCIALVEALTGSRPVPALETTQVMPKVPPIAGVSARCRRAILRGLAPDPARRFATMDGLAQALRPRPRPYRAAGWLAAVGLSAAGGLWVWPSSSAPSPSCEGAAQIEPLWNADRDAAIEARLLEAAPSFGAEAGRASTDALHDYTRAWVAAYDATCLEPPGPAADATRDCLRARLAALREAVDLLQSGDASVLSRAPKIVANLPDFSSCGEVDRTLPLPHDREQARQIEAQRQQLLRVGVLLDAGVPERAEAIVDEVLREARALDYRPLEAEALERLGTALDRAGHVEQAASTFEAGYLAAQAAGADETAARCAVQLIEVAVDRATFDQADTWARHARSLLDRFSGATRLEANLYRALGFVEQSRGDPQVAVAHYERAQQIEQQVLPAGAYGHGVTWANLAVAQESAGLRDEARRSHARALEVFEAHYGPRHPPATAVRGNLGASALEAGHTDEAAAIFTTCVEDFTAAFGPEHPAVLTGLLNLGFANLGRSRWDEAREQLERVLRVREQQLGPEHPDLVSPLLGLAKVAEVSGRAPRALEYMERGLRIREAALGEEHPAVAEVLGHMTAILLGEERNAEALSLATRAVEIAAHTEGIRPHMQASLLDRYALALARNERWDEARERYREAREWLAALGNPEHPTLAEIALHEAEGLLRHGEHVAGIEGLEDALTRSEGVPSIVQQQIRFSLAAALWDHTDQHARAEALARTALAALQAEDLLPELQAELQQWLDQHPFADPE